VEGRKRVEEPGGNEPTPYELGRFKTFITIQVLFLIGSPLAGAFRFKPWSLLDSAILVLAIGLSGLAYVLETPKGRRTIFRIAMWIYLLGVLDMSINILLSGIFGWKLLIT
jgi:hypothetical protein